MSSEEYPQNMNCIFCNNSQKQNISLSKSHPKVIIQIIANNSKNNGEHGKLAKNIMESDSSAVKLLFIGSKNTNHLMKFNLTHRLQTGAKMFSF